MKSKTMWIKYLIVGVGMMALMLISTLSRAAITIVGNGDDGTDLEGATPITSGNIFEARQNATALLKRLNVQGIRGLGNLIPELSHTELFLSKKNVATTSDDAHGPFHTNMRGQVYARTFARPHSATRFFPSATTLDEDQLIALHVHEALHRTLPESVREDEDKVSRVTLAITSPDATQDGIAQTVESVLPSPALSGISETDLDSDVFHFKPSTHFAMSASLGYRYQQFSTKNAIDTGSSINRMHVLESNLYPFGGPRGAFGLGIQASLLDFDGQTQSGPLNLSPRVKVFSNRGFEIATWADLSINTVSASEVKNSQWGRDVVTIGLSLRKELEPAYIENRLSWSSGGKSTETVGRVNYDYDFGQTLSVSIHGGLSLGQFRLGGFGEMNLADYFKVSGGAFSLDTGRYQVFSAGPELAFIAKSFKISLDGRYLLNSTKDTSFDHLGNIFGAGVGQGSAAASITFFL